MLYIDKNLEVRGIVYAYDFFNTKIFSYGNREKNVALDIAGYRG